MLPTIYITNMNEMNDSMYYCVSVSLFKWLPCNFKACLNWEERPSHTIQSLNKVFFPSTLHWIILSFAQQYYRYSLLSTWIVYDSYSIHSEWLRTQVLFTCVLHINNYYNVLPYWPTTVLTCHTCPNLSFFLITLKLDIFTFCVLFVTWELW